MDVIKFKIIDEMARPEWDPNYTVKVVAIYINDELFMDTAIRLELEREDIDNTEERYSHQWPMELYKNFHPDEELAEWQKEYGVEIFACGGCGCVGCGSPTVFIEQDDEHVYWKSMGHNQYDYNIPLNYVFDRKQYEAAMEELRQFAEEIHNRC